MKILIVEDDKRLSTSIRMYLEKQGYEVSDVTNGRRALNLLECDMHDGVISDVQMPGGNGIELLQAAWCSFDNIPPFYVHSSENTFYWADRQWDLPKVIPEAFGKFATFRRKKATGMFLEIQKWLDSIKDK